jgi:transposase-like protein
MTPSSLRFLGPKVYLATAVTLVTAMQQGVTAARVQRLSADLGIDRRTLGRWRKWWLETFAGPFRPVAMAAA